MIEIKKLRKKYPSNQNYTLNEINMTLKENGLYYLVGKSGSGKSTLLNILGLMDETYEGSVKADGKELKDFDEEEKAQYRFQYVSFLFQSYQAEDREGVKSNLLKALAISSLTESEKLERIDHWLKRLKLEEKKNELFKNLSGGEKKRIALIRALIKDSQLLLCDEPLSNLNPKLRVEITQVLKEESKKRIVFIITHEKDEIPEDAFIYEIKNGLIYLEKKGKTKERQKQQKSYDRKPFKGKAMFDQLIRNFLSKKEFLFLTLFSLMIGLFAISFSFQLSGSVSRAMQKSMSSYMDENSFVISTKDNSVSDVGFKNPDYATLKRIQSRHEEIFAVTSFYTTTLDPIFGNNQSCQLRYKNNIINLKSLSLNSFLEYRMPQEIEEKIYGDLDISDEEVIIGLDITNMLALYSLYFHSEISDMDESHLQSLSEQIKKDPIQLRVQANKPEWGYHLDDMFQIKGILLSKECFLVHPKETFHSNFVTETMHFLETDRISKIPPEKPWTLRKEDGFRIIPGKAGDFLKSFLYDEEAKNHILTIEKTPNYYQKKDIRTHNHIALKRDYLGKINLFEIKRFLKDHKEKVQSACFSSPIYTYTASGYICGFSKPFFFSKYKEKLNQIEDEATFSEEDLGSFQGSLIEEIPGVIKADLISSMNQKEGLSFLALNDSDFVPSLGEKPKNMEEIGISSRMAEILFHGKNEALGKKLCTLTLDRTTKEKNGYKNHFTQSEVTISGIYENEKVAIYQDSLFPLCFSFANGELSGEETRVQQAVIKVDLSKYDLNYYQSEIEKYGDYKGDFPMYVIISEIKKTLSFLSNLFLCFSILSLLSATGLLFLALFLILNKNKKEIGTLLSLGYTKKEISHFYLVFCQIIGFVGFLLSSILSIFTELILQKTLLDILDSYQFSFQPILITFLISISLTTFIGYSLSFKIKAISPKAAFDSVHT